MQQTEGEEMAAAATGWWVGRTEGGEAVAVVVAVAVAGEPFGSDNGKHSFSLRVSVHQCRGPRERGAGGGGVLEVVVGRLCQLTANTQHSHGNALGSQLPSCPTNKIGRIQASSPPRRTERGYKTANSGVWAYSQIQVFFFFLSYLSFFLWNKVLLRNRVAERDSFFVVRSDISIECLL